MLDKIWRFLKQLIQRVFRTFSQDFNPPWPPLGKGGEEETNLASPLTKGGLRGVPPTLTDAEYEAKLMELLEGVNQGWGRGDVAEFLLAKRIKDGDLAAWLRRFEARLLAGAQGSTASADAVVSLQELARRLELLGRVAIGELGECAGNVGREILVEFPLSSVEGVEVGERSAEGWYERGNEHGNLGQFEEAIDSYNQAIALKPDYHQAFRNRGRAQSDLGQFEEAIADYDKALEINPELHKAWISRGDALNNLGRFEEAIAAYDKALEFKPDDDYACYNRGIALGILGRLEEAIASYDKALKIKPHKHEPWYNRGVELSKLGRLEEAIASWDKALEIKPDKHEPWYNRGVELSKLGRLEEAIASYDKALEIKPDKHEPWYSRGIALNKLGRLEEVIASYDKALKIKPDKHEAWYNRGIALNKLGRLEEAIASYDKALEIEPDKHVPWYNRGNALHDLGKLEVAIASYDKALEIKPDYHEPWINRSIAVSITPRHNQPVYDILQVQFPNSPPVIRTLLTHNLKQRGYEGEILTLQAGLEYCQKNTHPEGYGELHQALGNAHYDRGKLNSRNTYWNKAAASYKEALKTLTPDAFLKLHLEVLQDLIKTLVSLKQTDEANKLQRDANDLLQRLLKEQNYSQLTQQQLTDKLVRFEQLTVNIFMQSGQFAEALATAETDKNVCLSWLLNALPTPPYETPKTDTYAEIQQLLNPTTAAIYWHLSDASLTTFIIRSEGLLSPETCISDFPDKFEKWVKEWNQQYTDYQSQEKTSQPNHPWRAGIESKFARLKEILKIDDIEQQLEGITDLILIPHRDLHRFPIHALFSRDFVVCYLPSAAVGINLKPRFTPPTPPYQGGAQENTPYQGGAQENTPYQGGAQENPPYQGGAQENPPYQGGAQENTPVLPLQSETLNTPIPPLQSETLNTPVPPLLRGARGVLTILSIENPRSVSIDKNGNQKEFDPLPAAEIESEIICRMFPNSTRLGEDAATLDEVEKLLQQPHDVFHFTGHGSYNFDNPLESTLYLSGNHRLTVREIIKHDLSNYKLICLPACETALTDKQTILAEYVGLTSGFMRAGVGCVVSTLWPVESGASALLMIYFYRQWQEAGESGPVALRNAQKWLREATREDLAAWYQGEIDKISANSPEHSEVEATLIDSLQTDQLALATMELHQPYQHPYYWAAFTITGL
jgi:tetratricopeptide (TPR) repeat protein